LSIENRTEIQKIAMLNLKPFSILLSATAIFALGTASAQCDHKATQKADFAYISNNFPEAINLYNKAAGKVGKDKAAKSCINYMVAKCYLKMNDYKRAESQLKKVTKIDLQNGPAHYEYALVLKNAGRYEEAKAIFEKYKTLDPNDPRAEIGIKSCELSIQWIQKPTCYNVENAKAWNSKDMDFSPFVASKKQDLVIFTSNRKFKGKGAKEWDTHGGLSEDLWTVSYDKKTSVWSEPKRMDLLSTEYSEGSGTMDNRYTFLYFTRCYADKKNGSGCRIYRTRAKGKEWIEPENVSLANDTFVTAHPTITGDGKFMIFASNMLGTNGGMDLWIAEFERKAKTFVKPVNLGPEINTFDNEVYPHLKLDGTLYFSSNRPEGMGGLDIYKATKLEGNTWGKVENMQYPINSQRDDFGIMFERGVEKGYLSSNRDGTKGLDDIWSFFIPPSNIMLSGTVRDKDTKEPLENAIVELKDPQGETIKITTDKMGFYKKQIPFGITYDMQASKEKYYNDVNRASSMGLDPLKTCKDTNIVADFNLKTTKVNLEFEIQFVFDREIVLPQYMDTVKNLQTILEDNPKTVVEIGAHTDARGNDDYNQRLSDRRADEIVRLLVEAGIPKARLTPKGYGETEPRKLLKDMKGLKSDYIFKKDTVLTEAYINEMKKTEGDQVFEDAHTINRRVSLKILSEDFKGAPAKKEDEE